MWPLGLTEREGSSGRFSDPGSAVQVVNFWRAHPGQFWLAPKVEIPDGLHVQGTPEARAAFLRLLRDQDDEVRAAASSCLPYFEKDPIRPDEALNLATDPVPEVRAHVARWLGWEAPAVALDPLLELAEDPSALVREHALDSLQRFQFQDARVFSRILQGFEDPAPAVLGQGGQADAPAPVTGGADSPFEARR